MSLEKLLENPRIWRGSSRVASQLNRQTGLASGYPKLDRCLPGGGWPPAALTEILTAQYGIGELRLLMPALAKLSGCDSKLNNRFNQMNQGNYLSIFGKSLTPQKDVFLNKLDEAIRMDPILHYRCDRKPSAISNQKNFQSEQRYQLENISLFFESD